MALSWHLARLARMHATEIGPRLGQAWIRRRGVRVPSAGPLGPPLLADVPPTADDLDDLKIFGIPVDPRDRIRWSADPTTGRDWPPGAHPLTAGMDPKPLWELGRLQHLAVTTADPTARREALHWCTHNPMGVGLGWASPLEVAVRLVSLVRIAAFWPDPALVQGIATHAAWIEAFGSVGSSARNHRVAELGALAVAAHAIPDCVRSPRWRRNATQLRGVLDDQIHPDGSGIEQSTGYLAFVVEWGLLARRAGIDGLDLALARGTRFLTTLVDPTGATLRIGDDDDGRALAGNFVEADYAASVAGAAAALLELPAPSGWRPDVRSTALGAPAGSPAAPRIPRTFPDGGLTVLPIGGGFVAMDHGPLGEPDLGAHGHADALSLWVHLADGPAIVGRGTGRYNADPVQRRFARGTRSHPTVVVSGADQSEPHDHPFLWRSRARVTVHLVDLGRRRIEASHDGYARLGVVHRRRVEIIGDDIVVDDTFEGDGRRHIAWTWPLDPTLIPHLRGSRIELCRGDRGLTIHPDLRCSVSVVRGGPRAGPGWHSPGYGRWIEASTVVLEARPRLPATFRTVMRLGTRIRSAGGDVAG